MSKERVQRAIELNVERIEQLFSTLDPFPFPERDLDRDAEEFIVGWARELPRDRPIRIVVHLPETELKSKGAETLGESIKRYFAYRAEIVSLDLKEIFRVGRLSLGIGAAVLALCVFAAQAMPNLLNAHPMARYVEESFIILGWVANWRPIEILLYDWWPVARRRHLFHRLAEATIELKSA